jgi:hypothetical protein
MNIYRKRQKEVVIGGLTVRSRVNNNMTRPICTACNQRLCAINCYRDGKVYYRSRCGYCIGRNKKIKTPDPKWKTAGYKKKPTCDRCGFKARYSVQLLVYHVDGNLNNNATRNLKTVCQNCAVEIPKIDLPWRAGDLEPDR